MIIKPQKLQSYLTRYGFSINDFAKLLNVDPSEVEKMLSGESVGYRTAHNFIYFLKAERAQHFIDWEKMNIKNPLKEN